MKIPWKWIIIGAVLVGVALYLYYSGVAAGAFRAVLDQLRSDESRVIKVHEENEKMYEDEITRLQGEVDQVKKEKATLQAEKIQVANERDALKGWINELQTKRDIIVVSDDPDRIIDDLRKLGLSGIRRRR